MSQFPQPPYSPQQQHQQQHLQQVPYYAYQPAGIDFSRYAPSGYGGVDLLAASRRASVLQGILGGMMLLCGACIGGIFWIVDIQKIFQQANVNYEQLMPGVTLERLRAAYTIAGAIGVGIGIALMVLALYVRRGTAAPAIVSIAICILISIVLGINLLGTLLMIAANPPAAVMGAIMMAIPLALFGLNVAWLVRSIRNASQVSLAQKQYQAQFYQYQYQQHAYSQGGYAYPQPGYGQAPPPGPQGPTSTSAPPAPQDEPPPPT